MVLADLEVLPTQAIPCLLVFLVVPCALVIREDPCFLEDPYLPAVLEFQLPHLPQTFLCLQEVLVIQPFHQVHPYRLYHLLL